MPCLAAPERRTRALTLRELTAHLGQPMVGSWDVVGVVACLVLAVGGVALGALGVTRRDMNA